MSWGIADIGRTCELPRARRSEWVWNIFGRFGQGAGGTGHGSLHLWPRFGVEVNSGATLSPRPREFSPRPRQGASGPQLLNQATARIFNARGRALGKAPRRRWRRSSSLCALTQSAGARSRPPAAPTRRPRRPNAATVQRRGDLSKRLRPGSLGLSDGRRDAIGECVRAGRVVRVGDCVGRRMAAMGGIGHSETTERTSAMRKYRPFAEVLADGPDRPLCCRSSSVGVR